MMLQPIVYKHLQICPSHTSISNGHVHLSVLICIFTTLFLVFSVHKLLQVYIIH